MIIIRFIKMENVKEIMPKIIEKNQEKLKDSKANENFENKDVNEQNKLKCVEISDNSSKLDCSLPVENQINTGIENSQQNECKLENNSTDMLPDNQYKEEPSQENLIHHSHCDVNKTIDVEEEEPQRRKIAVFEFDWALHIEDANKQKG